MRKASLPLVFVLLALGCGPAPAPDGDEGAGTAGGEEEGEGGQARQSARELLGINPPEQPWSEMSHADREMDMIGRFLPIFSEIFKEHSSVQYAAFGCETCHGSNMRERNFEMPSTELPPVPLPGTPAYQQMASEHPEDTRFMEETVTPTMQTMLGMGATFTCNGCHPVGS